MSALEHAAVEAAAATESQQKQQKQQMMSEPSIPTNGNNNEATTITQLALVPLRPPSKKKELEVKMLPIVLGRTNLAQWWYQSCDCQHYYCRLHCRPVAQNIGSLSKVMIQIDSNGKVFVVGKNPHLVTITPERKDAILRVNDILSIGRRDREPWMRFQVVQYINGTTIVPVLSSTRTVKRTSSSIPSGSDAALEGPSQKKARTTAAAAAAAAAAANNNSAGDPNGSSQNKSSSNVSSGVSKGVGSRGGGQLQQKAQIQCPTGGSANDKQASKQLPAQPKLQTKPADASLSQKAPAKSNHSRNNNSNLKQASSNNPVDGQLPEWITTTNAKRNRGNRSTSSLSVAPQAGTSTQQQQHQAMVARLAKAAASAAADNFSSRPQHLSTGVHASSSHRHHHHGEADVTRKHRRRAAGSSGRDTSGLNGSSKGIRSAEDLFNGSRSHYPQIHLMFQDYDTSAKLVKATQRNGAPDMSVRSPRTDQIFISKSEDSPPNRNHNCPSSNSTGCNADAPPNQLGLLSKTFAAALLGVAAPAPGPSDLHGSGVPPVVVNGERVVVNGVAQEPDGAAGAAVASQDLLSSARGRPAGRAHTRDDSATCRAVLAKYAAEKEAAARRRGGTQAEGEKTSELEE